MITSTIVNVVTLTAMRVAKFWEWAEQYRNADVEWGPLGETVYKRTYSRIKEDGANEEWFDTVTRIVLGNVSLVDEEFIGENEREELFEAIFNFKIQPGGRHIWSTGAEGRQYLANCFVAPWGDSISNHSAFLFGSLMAGGGVGANYSDIFTNSLPSIKSKVKVWITCSPNHKDFIKIKAISGENFKSYPNYFEADESIIVDDSKEGWVNALSTVLERSVQNSDDGTHIVIIDVSMVRPYGDPIRGFGGTASGPGPLAEYLIYVASVINERVGSKLSGMDWMDIDHEAANTVIAGNTRRSARMSIMNWDDPEIFEFINCKADHSSHWSTNISIGLDDNFWNAFDRPMGPEIIEQLWKHSVSYRQHEHSNNSKHEHAIKVFQAGVLAMKSNGEPGFVNFSLHRKMVPKDSNVWATNPCGEIMLDEGGSCVLGHVNLAKFRMDSKSIDRYFQLNARWLLRATQRDYVTEFEKRSSQETRRIGAGVLGLQEWAGLAGIRYDQISISSIIEKNLARFKQLVIDAANYYADEMGWNRPRTYTCLAPTGTTSLLSGNSSSAQTIFAPYYIRRVRFGITDLQLDFYRVAGYKIEQDIYSSTTMVVEIPTRDTLVDKIGDLAIGASEVSIEDYLKLQAFLQRVYADNAISFTINLNSDSNETDSLEQLLRKYLPHLKGTTIFPEVSRPQSPFERISKAQYNSYLIELQEAGNVEQDCVNGACPIR